MAFFRRTEKRETKQTVEPSPDRILIEKLCGGDKELCEASNILILVNPELVAADGPDAFVERAHNYEKAKDTIKARIAYQTAGEIALYEEDLQQARGLFRKAAEMDPSYAFRKVFDYFNQEENAGRVLRVAQEFYSTRDKRANKIEGKIS